MKVDNASAKKELDAITANNGANKLNKIYFIPQHSIYILESRNSITDTVIDSFVTKAIKVIQCLDPSLEYEPKYREAHRLLDNAEPLYSEDLRKSVIESLATLYNNQEQFHNCSTSYIENRITKSLKELYDANINDWKFWYTNRKNLQTLAQINPQLYIDTIKKVIANDGLISALKQQTKTVFSFTDDSLYEIRLSIQVLAYAEEYFAQCIQLLQDLSKRENNTKDNKSLDAIINIINPYHPQTNFPEKNIPGAVQEIISGKQNKQYVYKRLLPHNLRSWYDIMRPTWIKEGSLYKNDSSLGQNGINKNCWRHFDSYVHAFIKASQSRKDIFILLNEMPYIDEKYLGNVRNAFIIKSLKNQPENEKNNIWQQLVIIKNKTKNAATIRLIDELCDIYKPKDVLFRAKILFDQPDYELIDNKKKYTEQNNEIRDKLVKAVTDIYISTGGSDKLMELIRKAVYTDKVSYAIGNSEIRDAFLPKLYQLLNSTNKKEKRFAEGLIYQIFEKETMDQGLKTISYDQQNKATKLKILLCIRPNMLVWNIAKKDQIESKYWKKSNINPQANWSSKEIEYSVRMLNEVKRSLASVEILFMAILRNINIEPDLAITTLLNFSIKDGEYVDYQHSNEILNIINYLNDKKCPGYQLAMIELKFISLFEIWDKRNTPNNLILLLSTAPEVFYAMYDLQYSEKGNSYQYYKITHELHVRPGINRNNIVTKRRLKNWINSVESHYKNDKNKLEEVQNAIGQNLASDNCHAPQSEKYYLELLDIEENSEYRNGFAIGVVNSRGVISIDEKFEEEKNLIKIWNRAANEIDAKGYRNTARLYRDIAKEFENDMNRMAEHLKRRSIAHD